MILRCNGSSWVLAAMRVAGTAVNIISGVLIGNLYHLFILRGW
jgi:hypothetical protein